MASPSGPSRRGKLRGAVGGRQRKSPFLIRACLKYDEPLQFNYPPFKLWQTTRGPSSYHFETGTGAVQKSPYMNLSPRPFKVPIIEWTDGYGGECETGLSAESLRRTRKLKHGAGCVAMCLAVTTSIVAWFLQIPAERVSSSKLVELWKNG